MNACFLATPQEIAAIKEAKRAAEGDLKPYVFLHVNILREYLEHALKFNIPGIPWNLERAIDDWVFMCFFVGNDFLPHLPSLEIREGAISTLSLLWKQCMVMMGGYMTENGEVREWFIFGYGMICVSADMCVMYIYPGGSQACADIGH